MRIARNLTLLAMLAIAATTLAAPSALAQTEPLLHDQAPRLIVQQEISSATDTPCPAVTPAGPPSPSPITTAGGCRVHVALGGTSSFVVTFTVMGITAEFSCQIEMDMRIDNAAEGYFSHIETAPTEVCTKRPCGTIPPAGEGRAWSFYMKETEVAGVGPKEDVTFLMCWENLDASAPMHCEVTVPITHTATNHRYVMSANNVNGHGNPSSCQLRSTTLVTETAAGLLSGENESRQNVEIRHT